MSLLVLFMLISLSQTSRLLAFIVPSASKASRARMSKINSSSSSSSGGPISATDLFSQWAREGRDVKMAEGHGLAVYEILSKAQKHIQAKQYSFIDIGCGNGWAVEAQATNSRCLQATGVDGAIDMIKKAQEKQSQQLNSTVKSNNCPIAYYHADITSFTPPGLYDLAHSMEVMYYLDEAQVPSFLKNVNLNYLKSGGLFVMGIDHYMENLDCHGWSELNNTPMLLWSEERWRREVEEAGFEILDQWRAAKREGMSEGTMAIVARKK